MTLDHRRFFQRASLLPLGIPAIALAVWYLMGTNPDDQSLRDWTQSIAGIVAWIGAVSSVPYIVFLLVLHLWIRPTTAGQWLRVLWLSPLAIAVASGVAFGLRVAWVGLTWKPAVGNMWNYPWFTPGHVWKPAVANMFFFGEIALVTGYVWATVIWLMFRVARDRGWVVIEDRKGAGSST